MKWAILKHLQEQNIFSSLDLHFARRAAHYLGTLSENEAAVLMATMAAARQGHLCIDRKSIKEIFPLEGVVNDSFCQIMEKGFTALEEGCEQLKPFLCKKQGRYYLPKNWVLENALRLHLKRLASQQLDASFPHFSLLSKLNEEQRQAVATALQHRLTLVTGGPGTGKTFTAAAIAEAFMTMAPSAKICLAAPTARAADHLKKKLFNAVGDSHSLATRLRYAGTLHGLLGYKNLQNIPEVPWLDTQLIIVDECSMIDAGLFVSLLASLPEQTTIILMGDPDQLHPVGIGSLFSDLVYADLGIPIGRAHLIHCLRVDDRPLLELASALQKNLPCTWPLLDWSVDPHHREDFYKKLWEFVRPFLEMPSSKMTSHSVLLEQLSRFRILSVLRQGHFGAEELNNVLASRLHALAKPGDWWAAPIQITRNDATTGLCNGELGVLIQPKGAAFFSRHADGYALFSGVEHPLSMSILPAFEYAFCSSVHKSQGSEYEEVLLIVPPGSETFGREMLYTAVTRAKRKLSVVSTPEILDKVQKHRLRKLSGIF